MSEALTAFTLKFENLKDWCERNEYEFAAQGDLEQIAINYQLMDQSAPLMFIPMKDRDLYVLAMRQPYTVPADRFTAILTATNRLNALSFVGAWSLNVDSGELFFRLGLTVADIVYTDKGLLSYARAVVGNSEQATPTLHAIAIEGADPEAALAALIT
jgi:hypothetical protein